MALHLFIAINKSRLLLIFFASFRLAFLPSLRCEVTLLEMNGEPSVE